MDNKQKSDDDNKSFQYAATATLNYEDIGKSVQRISSIMLFINIYDWKE